MAPKAEKAKVEQKKKAVEDKTFGLKNKNKSSKVQKYVQEQVKQVTQKSAKEARLAGAQPTVKDKRKAEEEREKELAALFAVAIKQPKVPLGVDPKSVVCEFFRHGQCQKGFKCKFSHDLNVERKTAKIDLFTDQREVGKSEEEEGMEDWDQEQLEKVVKEKHGKEEPANKTEIVCKFFLDAVEKRQYGWFWKCPNGGDCKYRHALPPGYILKSQMKELLEEEARNKKDVAEQIEEERQKVDARTPITEVVFREWKARKQEEKRRRQDDEEDQRRRKGILNGREIFMQEGFVAEDDAGAADNYEREVDEEAEIKRMEKQAEEAAALARTGEELDESAEPSVANGHNREDGAGPSSSSSGPSTSYAGPSGSGAGPSGSGVATTLHLREEDAALFLDDDDDDDDDDEEEDDEGEEEGGGDDDDDDEDLDALEASVRHTHLGPGNE